MEPEFDPAKPLRNPRYEMFATHYSGDCYGNVGNAYKAAGYVVNTKNIARVNGDRLLRKDFVRARIDFLRQRFADQIAIDQGQILAMRLETANTSNDPRVRLEALRDIERARGWLPPAQPFSMRVSGDLHHTVTPVMPSLTEEQREELRARVRALLVAPVVAALPAAFVEVEEGTKGT